MPRHLLPTLLFALYSLYGETCHAQAYGLTTRPTVAPYLNGVMPAQPPVIGTNWTPVVAFQNLTFLNPMGILPMPGTTKLVVWEREGRMYHFENTPLVGNAERTLIVDFSTVCQGWDDAGFLGIAFHPQFDLSGTTGNRYLYVWYNHTRPGVAVIGSPTTRPDAGQDTINRLSRFTLNASGVAVPGSELVIIEQLDSSVWHNGGGMFFHPVNGFLYLTNGDDADGGNTQRLDRSLFSGVLRIDVDKRGGSISHAPPRRAVDEISPNWPQYFIPNDNPFVGLPNVLEEFFAIGLRSPHRMTIDPPTGRIFIGDVGNGAREEITAIEPTDAPGLNLQWDRIEGYNGDLTAPYIGVNKRPIIDYTHSEGNAVIGGYVYRGPSFPELVGKYIFADNGGNQIWYLDESTHTATTPATKVLLATLPKGPGPNSGSDYTGISSFGLDANNELYICQLSSTAGRIYKLQRGGPPAGSPLPATLSATGVFGPGDLTTINPSAALIPYALNHPFWSDGAVKSRWAVVPNTANIGFTATGEWTWPEGSVWVKHFELPVDDTNPAVRKRLETRLLVKNATGVYGATYKWRANNQDADLIDNAITENIAVATAPVGALTSVDIGGPTAGTTNRVGDVVTMTAGGTDIWGAADQFRFAHQQRTGDFDLAVRVESLTQPDLYTKAGLMARESLAAGSRHVFALVFPSNAARNNNTGGYEWQARTATSGGSTAIYPAAPQPPVNFPNTWVRLQRSGDTFIGSSSADGVWWTEFARQTVTLPATVYLGLAATAHAAAPATATAKFHLQSSRFQPWSYPSRSDCVTCHSTNAGGVLGPKTRQLNNSLLYPNAVTDNQLRAWAHIGLFTNPPAENTIPTLDALAALGDPNSTLEKRARSYLDSNCASCHRPGGNAGQALWDARYDTPLAQKGLIYGRLSNHLGDPTSCVIVPQDLSRSILYQRASTVGPIQMPPLAKNMVDTPGAALLAQWIGSLTANTPPVVALTSPPGGAVFNQSDVLTLSASASDADGLQRVEFYDGDFKIGEDTTAPYSIVWSGAARGAHSIYALAVDGVGNTGASAVAVISVQSTPITGWAQADIGLVGLPGDAYYDAGSGTYTVNGSGGDIWGNADGFHYLYRQINGDGTLTARVVSVGDTDGWAKAGVMFRESLAPGSEFAFSLVAASNGAHHQYRATTNGNAEAFYGPGEGAPYWVRMVRAGTSFSASISPNGTTWTLLSTQTIPMNSSIYVGLAVTAHNNGAICTAEFDNVTLTTQSPQAVLTAPLANAAFYNPTALTLTATATAGASALSRVEFYANGTLLGQDTTAPYSFTWNPPLYGTHELSAQAVDAAGRLGPSAPVPVTLNIANTPGFRGEYYDNADFTNLVLVRADAGINFPFGTGSPDPRMEADDFSVRWSGSIRPRYTQTYTLTSETDDGVRVWLNGQLLINQWYGQAPTRHSATIALTANQAYDLVMEYYEGGGGASARLYWSSASQAEEIIPASRVTVPPPVNAAPSVWLSTPLVGNTYLNSDSIPISASASDADGTIARVEFWADGVKLGERTVAPYTWSWAGPRSSGAHALWATAVDNGGASASSAQLGVQSIPLVLLPAGVQQTTNPAGVTYSMQTTVPVGRTYVIEWSPNLSTWTLLQGGTSNGSMIEVIDATTGLDKRFYRMRITN